MPKRKAYPKCSRFSNRLKGVAPPELETVPEEDPIDETTDQSDSGASASRPNVVKRTGRDSGYSELASALLDGGEEFF